jgi:hypothetical protein
MQELRRWASLLIIAAMGVACTDSATDQSVTSPPLAAASKASSTTQIPGSTAAAAKKDDTNKDDPQVKFHKKNYADWVGKAHNKALDDFAAMFAHTAPTDLCAQVAEFMSDAARVPPEQYQGTREERRAYAVRGLSATHVCQNQLAVNGSSRGYFVGTVASATFSASVAGVSAAANSLLDQIRIAQSAATTASGLAANLTPILSQADQLVSGERDLVYSVASVVQSSFEYWQANLAYQAQDVSTTYGGCLVQFSTEAYALSRCMGVVAAPVAPVGYRNLGNSTRIIFAASRRLTCEGILNRGAIVGYDFGGAVTGGAWGLIGGPGGVLLGAINGGGAASATESWYQFGRWAYCMWRNGTGPRPAV